MPSTSRATLGWWHLRAWSGSDSDSDRRARRSRGDRAERRENSGAAPSYLSPAHTARLKLFWAGVKG